MSLLNIVWRRLCSSYRPWNEIALLTHPLICLSNKQFKTSKYNINKISSLGVKTSSCIQIYSQFILTLTLLPWSRSEGVELTGGIPPVLSTYCVYRLSTIYTPTSTSAIWTSLLRFCLTNCEFVCRQLYEIAMELLEVDIPISGRSIPLAEYHTGKTKAQSHCGQCWTWPKTKKPNS